MIESTLKQYYINKHISLRKIANEYLVYSGYVRETMLIDVKAYSLILFMQETQRNFQEMLNHLKVINKESGELELVDYINMTLKQFIECGVVGFKQ